MDREIAGLVRSDRDADPLGQEGGNVLGEPEGRGIAPPQGLRDEPGGSVVDLRAAAGAGEEVAQMRGEAGGVDGLTVNPARHGVVDLRAGLLVGAGAAVAAPAGTAIAALVSPATGSLLFSLFLLAVVANTLRRERVRRRKPRL